MTNLAKKFESAARICGNLSPKFELSDKYNYRAALYNDLCTYAAAHAEEFAMMAKEQDFGGVLEEMTFNADEVTGNASGSYFFNSWKAEDALCHNFNLAVEACEEMTAEKPDISDPEKVDVIIRCYLLAEMAGMVEHDIAAVLDSLAKDEDETEIELAGYMQVTVTRNPDESATFKTTLAEKELGTIAA